MIYIKSLKIVPPEKVKLLYDPVLDIKKINEKKFLKDETLRFKGKKYFLAAGRLTKQKNFLFLCKAFYSLVQKYPNINLLIAGEGEEKKKINNYILKKNLEDKIFLIGHVENIFSYLRSSEGFILSSLWEDPGFVLIEAAFCKTPILSSNCGNGPKELIQDKVNGVVFESNNLESFKYKFSEFMDLKKSKNKIIINSLKMSNNFTLFSHFKKFNQILSNENF